MKYTGIVFGTIGLIFTAYRIYDENSSAKTIPVKPATAETPTATPTATSTTQAPVQNANLQTKANPDLQEKKQ